MKLIRRPLAERHSDPDIEHAAGRRVGAWLGRDRPLNMIGALGEGNIAARRCLAGTRGACRLGLAMRDGLGVRLCPAGAGGAGHRLGQRITWYYLHR